MQFSFYLFSVVFSVLLVFFFPNIIFGTKTSPIIVRMSNIYIFFLKNIDVAQCEGETNGFNFPNTSPSICLTFNWQFDCYRHCTRVIRFPIDNNFQFEFDSPANRCSISLDPWNIYNWICGVWVCMCVIGWASVFSLLRNLLSELIAKHFVYIFHLQFIVTFVVTLKSFKDFSAEESHLSRPFCNMMTTNAWKHT